jgi:hypothetical protein
MKQVQLEGMLGRVKGCKCISWKVKVDAVNFVACMICNTGYQFLCLCSTPWPLSTCFLCRAKYICNFGLSILVQTFVILFLLLFDVYIIKTYVYWKCFFFHFWPHILHYCPLTGRVIAFINLFVCCLFVTKMFKTWKLTEKVRPECSKTVGHQHSVEWSYISFTMNEQTKQLQITWRIYIGVLNCLISWHLCLR